MSGRHAFPASRITRRNFIGYLSAGTLLRLLGGRGSLRLAPVGGTISAAAAAKGTVGSPPRPSTVAIGQLPTGGTHGPIIYVRTLGEIREELQSPTTDPRRVVIPEDVQGVLECPGEPYFVTINRKKNFDFIGHRRVIIKGRIKISDAENYRIRNLAVRIGDASGIDPEDGDNFEVRKSRHALFDHISASWSIDEAMSSIRREGSPPPEKSIYQYCFCYEPLHDAGHPKGNHTFGPLHYQDDIDIMWRLNLLLGFTHRSVAFGDVKRAVFNNNVVGWLGAGANVQGTNFGSALGTSVVDHGCEAIVLGNLYYYWSKHFNDPRVNRSIRLTGALNRVYLPPSDSDYPNRFFHPNGHNPDFSGGVYTRERVENFHDGATPAQLVDGPTFALPPELAPMPTRTVTQAAAVFWHVIHNCGCRAWKNGSYEASGDELVPGLNAMSNVDRRAIDRFLTAKGTEFPFYRQTPRTIVYDTGVPG